MNHAVCEEFDLRFFPVIPISSKMPGHHDRQMVDSGRKILSCSPQFCDSASLAWRSHDANATTDAFARLKHGKEGAVVTCPFAKARSVSRAFRCAFSNLDA